MAYSMEEAVTTQIESLYHMKIPITISIHLAVNIVLIVFQGYQQFLCFQMAVCCLHKNTTHERMAKVWGQYS